ncbi:hypothetical protein GCM10023148_30470 [Actinokineospora soli]
MRRLTLVAAGLAAGALGISGCTGAAGPPVEPTSPAATSAVPSGPPVPGVVIDVGWREFGAGVPLEHREIFEVVGRRYALGSDPGSPVDDPNQRARVVDRETGRVVYRFQPAGPERLPGAALFFERYALIIDQSYAKSDGPDPVADRNVLWRVDLNAGTAEKVRLRTAKGLGYFSWSGEYGGEAVMMAVHPDGRECVLSVNPDTLAERLVHCVPRDKNLLQVNTTRDGISMLLADGGEQSTYDECKSRWWLDRGGDPRQLNPDAGCTIWEGIVIDGWEVTAALDPTQVPLHDYSRAVAVRGDRRVDLGPILSSTLVACGEHVYWLTEDYELDAHWQEVRRWRPGTDRVETVLHQADEHGRRPPACTQGVFSTSHTAYKNAEPTAQHTRYLDNP